MLGPNRKCPMTTNDIEPVLDLKSVAMELLLENKTAEQLAADVVDLTRQVEEMTRKAKDADDRAAMLADRLEKEVSFSSQILSACNTHVGRYA